MNLSEKEQQVLDRKPSIMKFVAKQLLRGINSILNDECDENELANTISHMDKLGTAFVDPDEYWNYDRCMDELGMGQNRAAFTALMKKHGIKKRKVNNVHVGFPKADIIALKHELKEDFKKRQKRQNKKETQQSWKSHIV